MRWKRQKGAREREELSEKASTPSRVASRAAVEEVDCFLTPVRSRGPPWRSRELLYRKGQHWSHPESLVVDKGEEREVNRCLLDFFACIKMEGAFRVPDRRLERCYMGRQSFIIGDILFWDL
jgi:hypothetical protein